MIRNENKTAGSSEHAGLRLCDLEHTVSIADTIAGVYRHINALDRAGRRDLSLPLREIVDRMWDRGSNGAPNPFILRYLEKQTAQAWAQYCMPAAPAVQSEFSEDFVLRCGRFAVDHSAAGQRVGHLGIHRSAEGLSFEFGITVRGNFSDLEALERMLDYGSDESHADARALILGQERDFTGIRERSYELKAGELPCTLRRRFGFHSAVEIDDTLTFRSLEDASRFAEMLRERASEHADGAVAEFIETLEKSGPARTVTDCGVPTHPDGPDARRLQNTFGITRSELTGYLREVREAYAELCFEPGMTGPRMRAEAGRFWERLEQHLRELFPRAG